MRNIEIDEVYTYFNWPSKLCTVTLEMELSGSLVAGKRVLLVWQGGNATETIQQVVEDLRQKAGEVLLEHAQRLIMGQ